MVAPGYTWGISGPTFLLAYAVLAVVAVVAVTRVRRALADVPARPTDGLDRQPYDVAYLNGGAELALCAALSAMHRSGTIAVEGRGTVVAAARPDPRSDELERAVHHAAARPLPRRQLAQVGAVASALARIESRLVAAGLLLDEPRRSRIRSACWPTFAVAALGLVRIVAGTVNGRPVGFLVVLVLAVLGVGVGQLVAVRRRSPAGNAALCTLTARHHALSPSMRPDWAVYGPAGAALAVGVFGLSALWTADPAFAGELELSRATAAGSGVTGGSGGDGGSGGGDSGGGGCGGGGGGCGG